MLEPSRSTRYLIRFTVALSSAFALALATGCPPTDEDYLVEPEPIVDNKVTHTATNKDTTPVNSQIKGGVQLPKGTNPQNPSLIDPFGNTIQVTADPGVKTELDIFFPPPPGREWHGYVSDNFIVPPSSTSTLVYHITKTIPTHWYNEAIEVVALNTSSFGDAFVQCIKIGSDPAWLTETCELPIVTRTGVITQINPDNETGTVETDSTSIGFYDPDISFKSLSEGTPVSYDVVQRSAPPLATASVPVAVNLQFLPTVPVQQKTWGSVKRLYEPEQ